jgi:hypothetical protein
MSFVGKKDACRSVVRESYSVHKRLREDLEIRKVSGRVNKSFSCTDTVIASSIYRRWPSPFGNGCVEIKNKWEATLIYAGEKSFLNLAEFMF